MLVYLIPYLALFHLKIIWWTPLEVLIWGMMSSNLYCTRCMLAGGRGWVGVGPWEQEAGQLHIGRCHIY